MIRFRLVLIIVHVAFTGILLSASTLCHSKEHIWTEKSLMPDLRWGRSTYI